MRGEKSSKLEGVSVEPCLERQPSEKGGGRGSFEIFQYGVEGGPVSEGPIGREGRGRKNRICQDNLNRDMVGTSRRERSIQRLKKKEAKQRKQRTD